MAVDTDVGQTSFVADSRLDNELASVWVSYLGINSIFIGLQGNLFENSRCVLNEALIRCVNVVAI